MKGVLSRVRPTFSGFGSGTTRPTCADARWGVLLSTVRTIDCNTRRDASRVDRFLTSDGLGTSNTHMQRRRSSAGEAWCPCRRTRLPCSAHPLLLAPPADGGSEQTVDGGP